MKDLIPILYMFFAVGIFVAGFVIGRDAERASENNESSFFCVQNTQEENTKKTKTSEEEDNRNQFFR